MDAFNADGQETGRPDYITEPQPPVPPATLDVPSETGHNTSLQPIEVTDRPTADAAALPLGSLAAEQIADGRDEVLYAALGVDLEWEEIDIRALADLPRLTPGHVITGIGAIAQFNEVERQAVLTVREGMSVPERAADDPFTAEKISRDPVANHIRPRWFNGNLRDGRAIVLPFSVAAMVEHEPRFGTMIEHGAMHITDEQPGLRVVYMGGIHSSRPGLEAHISLDSTYSLRRSFTRAQTTPADGFVRRTLGDPKRVEEAAAAVAKLRSESISVAREHARFAAKHVIKIGLPGSARER